MKSAFLIDAVRTPIGKFKGALADVRTDDLAAHVLQAILARNASVLPKVDQVVFGATNQAGEDNRNVARMAVLLAGLPYEVPAVTVNRLCGSGLEAVIEGAMRVQVGDADVVVCGGVESMTRAPFVMKKSEEVWGRNPPTIFDTTIGWRFENPKMAARFPLHSMGETAENVAEIENVSREEMDEFGARSQQLAVENEKNGFFEREITPVTLADGSVVTKDDGPRDGTTVEKLAALKPAFRPDGKVTAGNACPLNDGAAAVIVMSDTKANEFGVKPLARIVASGVSQLNPEIMGLGPIEACRQALKRANMSIDDIDLVEINEAFAAQVIPSAKHLGIPLEKLNVHGGAIALGHPFGMTGARIMTTLINGLEHEDKRFGLESMCVGGGQGMAMIIERL